MVKIPKHIIELEPYRSGKPIEELARERGIKKIVKLASNENPIGPSPKALEAIKASLINLNRYPNPSAHNLVDALSAKLGIPPERIITGSGSDSLLQYTISTFSEKNDELLSSEGSFIGWYVNANKYNRKLKLSPLTEYTYNLSAILNNISDRTRIIYLANPNNPTGTLFTRKEFEYFLSKVPGDILIVLDEAYTVYAESDPDYPNGLDYDLPNLIVTRTLSKAYGLAGLRIGFAVGHEDLIKMLYKVKLPFEPNNLAQEAAIAALEDEEFLRNTVELNRLSLSMMTKKFDELGLKYIPTSANFHLLLFNSENMTSEFAEECMNNGLILRHVKSFGIPNGIRINSGTIYETIFALEVIEKVLYTLQKRKPTRKTAVK